MKALLLSIACSLATTLCAQQDTSLVRYQPGFAFREGVYFGFEDFRDNRPSVLRKDLLDKDKRPVPDLRQSDGRLFYTDTTGTQQAVDMERIWGFCDHNVVYVRSGNGFNRIGMMGSLAHLLFDVTYSNWGGYYSMYGYGTNTYTVQEQRVLDMESGAFLPVSMSGILPAIERDRILLEEYSTLSKKERRAEETVFRFIRRYNERHPLYFPR
jgi:hypothetical protein